MKFQSRYTCHNPSQYLIALFTITSILLLTSPGSNAIQEHRDSRDVNRLAEVEAIRELGINVNYWFALVSAFHNDPSVEVRGQALFMMSEAAPQDVVLPYVFEALAHHDREIHVPAIHILRQLEPDPATVTLLCNELRRNARGDDSYIYETLQRFGPDACPAVPALIDIVQEYGDFYAIRTLGTIGSKANPAVPALLEILEIQDGSLSYQNAMESIGRIGGLAAEGQVPRIIEIAVEQQDSIIGSRAVNSLGYFGEAASSAIPVLREMLRNAEGTSRVINIHFALYSIGDSPDEHLQAIIDGLYSEDFYIVSRSLWAVSEIGPSARAAESRLREIIETGEYSVGDFFAFPQEALDAILADE